MRTKSRQNESRTVFDLMDIGFRSIGIGRFVSFCYLRVTLSLTETVMPLHYVGYTVGLYVVSIIYVVTIVTLCRPI